MVKENIGQLFERDLQKLKQEIDAYQDESILWQTMNGISNSAGNLCLHLLGNLNNFIGAKLGNTGYIRNREQEFSLKNIPKSTLLKEIDKVIEIVRDTLNSLSDEELSYKYPEDVLGPPMTTGYFLIHLAGHLNYHLGQINYHRRILTAIKSQVESFIQNKPNG